VLHFLAAHPLAEELLQNTGVASIGCQLLAASQNAWQEVLSIWASWSFASPVLWLSQMPHCVGLAKV
jgi:cyanate permease